MRVYPGGYAHLFRQICSPFMRGLMTPLTSAIRCLELLGKHLGMFKEKTLIETNVTTDISVEDARAKLLKKLTNLALQNRQVADNDSQVCDNKPAG